MCVMMYMAAESEVPLIPWDDARPAFHATALSSPSDFDVRGRLTKPHVVYLGSHEGCGCGFLRSEPELFIDPDPDPATLESMRNLAKYVNEVVNRVGPVELYMCWDADQTLETLRTSTISCSDLSVPGYAIPCRTLIQVNA
jgi:hypothetical protein